MCAITTEKNFCVSLYWEENIKSVYFVQSYNGSLLVCVHVQFHQPACCLRHWRAHCMARAVWKNLALVQQQQRVRKAQRYANKFGHYIAFNQPVNHSRLDLCSSQMWWAIIHHNQMHNSFYFISRHLKCVTLKLFMKKKKNFYKWKQCTEKSFEVSAMFLGIYYVCYQPHTITLSNA